MNEGPSPRSGARLYLALAAAAGAAVALLGLNLVPPATSSLGPALISTKATLGQGATVLRVPPFGAVAADTHNVPISLSVTLAEVDPTGLARVLSDSPQQELLDRLEADLRAASLRLGLRLVLAGAVLGAFAAALLPGRRRASIVAGTTGGLLSVALLLGLASATYEVSAFEEPQFTGALERAPQLIEAVQKQAGSLEALRSRFEAAAVRLQDVLALVAEPLDNPRVGTVAVLHVSDIHSNPVGVELAKRLVEQFRVDAVIDTGDLTSFGEPIEARIGQLIAEIPAPYLFVPGNHDSDSNRAQISEVEGIVLLHDDIVEIRGLRIMGWADPTLTARGDVDREESTEEQVREAQRVADRVRQLRPDVLAVHQRPLAEESVGSVPVILAGHRHRQSIENIGGTWILEVGSTGATGLGSFLVEADLDYEAEILYFRDGEIVALDYVRFRGLGGDFEIQRRTLA